MRNKIENTLKEIIRDCGENVNLSLINNDTNLIELFRFTSINVIQLIVAIEEKFNIEVDNDDLDLDKISIFSNLLAIVLKNIKDDYVTN